MRIVFLLLIAAALYGQNSAGDWPMFNRDLAATRYSPLTQINAKNVAKLTRAWSYKLNRHPSSGSITGGASIWPMRSAFMPLLFRAKLDFARRQIGKQEREGEA
jgi:hypothetical protein